MLASAAQSRSKADTTKVDSGCATGTQAGTKAADDALRNGFRTKAEMDDANSIAIAQALQELYEQEEDNRIFDGLAGPPAPGGLTWDPELGLQAMAAPPKPPASAPPLMSNTKGSQSRPANTSASAPGAAPPRTSRPNRPPAPETNPHGRPVSRLVREAEAKQSRQHGGSATTPAVQNWPTSETGANFGAAAASTGRPTTSSSDGGSWGCPKCTFHNHGSMNKCEICSTTREPAMSRQSVPGASYGAQSSFQSSQVAKPLGWTCSRCGTWMESQWWTCRHCGTMKNSS
jgi:hypothetical protein